MQELYKSGKYYFAFAIIAFGFIQLNIGNFMSAFLPVPETFPARNFFLYFISTVFVAGGICICIKKTSARASMLIGIVLLILFFYPHFVNLVSDLHNPGPWTAGGEMLGLAGGAFIIYGAFKSVSPPAGNSGLPAFGKILFALSLLIFAVQHFIYAEYITTLIPAWIPAKLFWSYFVGIGFAAGAISLFTNIKTRLACILLGFMFLFWVIFVHLPRVAADTHKETEKTSMFIALAFCGIFFTLASLYNNKSATLKN